MYGNGKHEIMKEKKLPQYLQWQNLSFIPLLSSCSALVISPLSFTCIQCCISHAPSSPVTLTTSFLQSSLLCNSHSVRNSIIPRRWISVPQERLRSPFPKALDQINWSFPPPRTHTHTSLSPQCRPKLAWWRRVCGNQVCIDIFENGLFLLLSDGLHKRTKGNRNSIWVQRNGGDMNGWMSVETDEGQKQQPGAQKSQGRKIYQGAW